MNLACAASLVLIGAAAASPAASAQSATPTPQPGLAARDAIAAFSIRPPDENSPFFSDREMARTERTTTAKQDVNGALASNQTAMYPSVNSENNAPKIFAKFFTSMFSSIRIGKLGNAKQDAEIAVDPTEFSLADRREVEATFLVRNNGKKILRLEYPTTQRVELQVLNGSGAVVERWSDDRAFSDEEGYVFINPGERIQYQEKIPTRDMQPGVYNEITGEVANHPDYSATRRFVPQP